MGRVEGMKGLGMKRFYLILGDCCTPFHVTTTPSVVILATYE
jgi:hypothetical protein